jgi:two-component system sensor histidine kinase VicK
MKVLSEYTDQFYLSEPFQRFFEKSANSLIIKANPPEFTVLAVSNHFLEITGCTRNQVLGHNLFSVFPGREQDDSEMNASIEKFMKAIETKERIDWPNFTYEIRNEQTGEMELQYWNNYHEPILNEEGEVAYILNTTQNITEQRLEQEARGLAEKKLQASEENLRNTVNQAPVGMCILSGDPLFLINVNDAFLKIVGKDRAEFQNKPFWEVSAEGAAFYSPIADQVIKTGIRYHAKAHEIFFVRNGIQEKVYVDFVFEPLKDLHQKAYGIMIVAIEVTAQILARKELLDAYEQLRLSKEAAELGTFDLNLVTGQMDWDARCRMLFGINHMEEVSFEQNFVPALDPLDKDDVLKLINSLLTDESLGGNYDTEFRTVSEKAGSPRWVRAKGKIYFNAGKPVRFIGSVLDITSQKEIEQRKNDFIGMVSHELKTPLTSMLAYQQMLAKKLDGNADSFTKVAMDKSSQQIRKMTALINGFLNISNLESGKIKLSKEFFDVKDLLEEVIDDFLLVNNTHTIVLNACSAAMVFADREKISSVVSNLISNAIKYSPIGKQIEINCQLEAEVIKVTVKDEGMGIKEADRTKLFERFYRISTSHRQNISGFGIGLYLSKEIIERHEGKIWVDSESGKGSVFTFILPVNS